MKPRSARNPSRRNRNIGTEKRGHGQDNKLVIPFVGRPHFARLGPHTTAQLNAGDAPLTLIVEHPRNGCSHSCTPDDLARMISLLPAADWKGIEYIILRQPKRKEELLEPVWGRLAMSFSYHNREAAAIILESFEHGMSIRWSRGLDPGAERELLRLRQDGMKVIERKREFWIQPSVEAVRSTQLFRTLLHEVGHWVDYKIHESSYWDRPLAERETAAHRYAEIISRRLRDSGAIPFPVLWSEKWPSLDKQHFSL